MKVDKMLLPQSWLDYIKLIKMEVVPAQGCTEPISVALAAALARSHLPAPASITAIHVLVSPNLMKNGMGVGIPGVGMTGLPIAAAAGVCGGNPDAQLEVLKGMTPETARQARAMLDAGIVRIGIKPVDQALYVECEVGNDRDKVTVIIENEHTNITSIRHNDRILFTADHDDPLRRWETERLHRLAQTTGIKEIWTFADRAPLSAIDFIRSAAELNVRIAQAGLDGEFGLRIGITMARNEQRGILMRDLMSEVIKRSAAASDARMDGCELPAMTNSGSGNQGIAATLPVVVAAEFFHSTEEQLLRALILSHFAAIHIKAHVDRLSALCAVSVAAMGASCGMVYLMGGNERQGESAILNMIGDVVGVICDGAKTGCSLKVSSCVGAAVKAALLAMDDIRITAEQGIIDEEVEKVIGNLGYLVTEGLKDADRAILHIMTSKQGPA